MFNQTIINLACVLAFLLPWAIFAANMFYPSGPTDGANVKWRPEPIVFAIVWTVLIIFLSVSWYLTIKNSVENKNQTMFNISNVLFVAVIASAVAWQIAYRKVKKDGVTCFIFLLFFLVPLISYLLFNKLIYSAMLLMPLLIWSIVAMIMNIIEVSQ
jgi:tryptophan-rich sensory protein